MGDGLAPSLPPLNPYSCASVPTGGRPAPSNYRCSRLTAGRVKVIHRLLEARPCEFSTFPTSRAGPGGREGIPGAGGKGALLPARERAGSEFSVSACPSLPWVYLALWGHHGGRGSSLHVGPGSPWPKPQRVPGCQARRLQPLPPHRQSGTVAVRGWAGKTGRAKAEPEGPFAACLDEPPPAGWPWVRRARWAKQGGVRVSCGGTVALSLLPPLPGLPPPLCLTQAVPAPLGSAKALHPTNSCCRPERDTAAATPTPRSSPAPRLLKLHSCSAPCLHPHP